MTYQQRTANRIHSRWLTKWTEKYRRQLREEAAKGQAVERLVTFGNTGRKFIELTGKPDCTYRIVQTEITHAS